jgi:hypothetical protein
MSLMFASLALLGAMSQVSQVSMFVPYDGVMTVMMAAGHDEHDDNCE